MSLALYQLPPSPNNLKARLGLGYKQLDYESHELRLDDFPGDRSEIVRVSSQPRTPVLVHDQTSIFDSGAILRYLEANFRDTPPLFSDDYATMGLIEEWEWFARAELSKTTGMLFKEAMSPSPNADTTRRAAGMMRNQTSRIEDRLTQSPWLAGSRMSAADITAAPLVALAVIPEEAPSGKIVDYFREYLKLGNDRNKTRGWLQKVLQYDTMTAPSRG